MPNWTFLILIIKYTFFGCFCEWDQYYVAGFSGIGQDWFFIIATFGEYFWDQRCSEAFIQT